MVRSSSRSRVRPGANSPGSVVKHGEHEDAVTKSKHLAKRTWNDFREHAGEVALIFALYMMRGIIGGLGYSLPFLLARSGLSYTDRALFGLSGWPNSLKLVWAPIVDALWIKSLGRRKTWILPLQALIGCLLIYAAFEVDGEAPLNVTWLTAIFFLLYLLASTMDIATDGWALSLLPPELKDLTTSASSMGGNCGTILSQAVLLTITNPQACSAVLPMSMLRPVGVAGAGALISMGQFVGASGVLCLALLPLVATSHPEPPTPKTVLASMALGRNFESEQQAVAALKDAGVVRATAAGGEAPGEVGPWVAVTGAYRTMLRIVSLPSVLVLGALLISGRGAFGGDAGIDLTVLQRGLPESLLAAYMFVLAPLDVLATMAIAGIVTSKNSLRVWGTAYMVRIVLNVMMAVLLLVLRGGVLAEWIWGAGGGVGGAIDLEAGPASDAPTWWLSLVVLYYVGIRFVVYTMIACEGAFIRSVADDAVGGTYVTMMTTMVMLGVMWPSPPAMAAMDVVDEAPCVFPNGHGGGGGGMETGVLELYCSSVKDRLACVRAGGHCHYKVDGCAVVVLACAAFGVVWLVVARSWLGWLEGRRMAEWRVGATGDLKGARGRAARSRAVVNASGDEEGDEGCRLKED